MPQIKSDKLICRCLRLLSWSAAALLTTSSRTIFLIDVLDWIILYCTVLGMRIVYTNFTNMAARLSDSVLGKI